MFKVLPLNDDYTPMDFVVMVLQKIFVEPGKATQVALKVHKEGIAYAVFTRGTSRRKVEQVNRTNSTNIRYSVIKKPEMIAQELEVSLHMAFMGPARSG